MIKPPRLRQGDMIAIVTPASPGPKTKLMLGVKRLQQAGFNVHIHNQSFNKRGYLAGDDKSRAQALMDVFNDDRIRAVFCARGGFGCARLLEFIDIKSIIKNPKIFIGYSDITILLQAFSKSGLVTFHGPMPAIDLARANYKFGLQNVLKAVTLSQPLGRLQNPKKLGPFKKYRPGRARGIITGGNLSLLQKLIGTEFRPSFKDKIVFLEDTLEEPYRIDGYLGHLFAATDIAQAAGFIFGEWVNVRITRRNYPSLTLNQVIDDYFGRLKVPIITNVACGHGRQNLTIPLGVKAFIDADNKTIEIIERAVS